MKIPLLTDVTAENPEGGRRRTCSYFTVLFSCRSCVACPQNHQRMLRGTFVLTLMWPTTDLCLVQLPATNSSHFVLQMVSGKTSLQTTCEKS